MRLVRSNMWHFERLLLLESLESGNLLPSAAYNSSILIELGLRRGIFVAF